MKNKKYIILGLVLLTVGIISSFLIFCKPKKAFFLEDKYYEKKEIVEISLEKFQELTANKESFVIFIYQPMCAASSAFQEVLEEFLNEHSISIYKIAYSDIKTTDLKKKIKYYPSFILYNKGKIVDYLEADKEADKEYYSSKEGFYKWISKYVQLKKAK